MLCPADGTKCSLFTSEPCDSNNSREMQQHVQSSTELRYRFEILVFHFSVLLFYASTCCREILSYSLYCIYLTAIVIFFKLGLQKTEFYNILYNNDNKILPNDYTLNLYVCISSADISVPSYNVVKVGDCSLTTRIKVINTLKGVMDILHFNHSVI